MQRRHDERKSDLRNASVLEVIFAIIIVLVILLHSTNLDFIKEKTILNQEIKNLTEINNKLKEQMSELRASERKLNAKIKELERKNKLLRKYVDAEATNEEIIAGLTEEILKLQDKVAVQDGQLAIAIKKLKDEGKGGLDKTFCRLPVTDASIRQKHKWLGQISWSEKGYTFEIDPKLNQDKAKEIPGVKKLISGSPLQKQEFETAAMLAKKHSMLQDPECRYFVKIIRDPKIDPPSSIILSIGKYFYYGARDL